MHPVLERHPLHTLHTRERTTATACLKRVAVRHQALGYGQMAYRKEEISRWIGGTEPELTAQLTMADLHGIAPEEVHGRGFVIASLGALASTGAH
ncbi:hypothetical protein ACFQ6V_17390 [Streptomyces roseifaciens]